ncbi:MAG TPA: heavy-metal-associated domain-containing protein [Sedimenticola thiotaurini]|uniref:Heavy-metal-associated domain-containing protein n=1 Tax=Sedimenticola thiotaurini TaxID=1543721 RepID=A0A831RJE6_9GAMM|nr:heavy-metal-associated domain-containing protein [Sedimenticola thiotaurini]
MSKISEFELQGACCANGIIRAKKVIKGIAGTGKVTIDLAQNIARVEGDVDPEAIVSALRAAKFTASHLSTAEQ